MSFARPAVPRCARSTPQAPIAAGDTLVVVQLDRLARSVSHLLCVIEQLGASGAHVRSLRDPTDTATL
jgi:DNA invertase Pin-like site-specific DNA recombinase